MQRHSGRRAWLEASFLYRETDSQPMHVCSVIGLDTSTMPGGYTFDQAARGDVAAHPGDAGVPGEARQQPLNLDAESNSVAKQHTSSIGATLSQDWSQFAGPAVFGAAMRDVSVGAALPRGLNITAMSLNGRLDIGLIACPELLPDLWELADEFAVVMAELLAATR